MARWTAAALLGLLATTASAGLRAEEADPLERGRQLVRAFEHDEAIRELQSVVDDPAAPAADRLEALAWIAAVHVRLEDEAAARAAFERLAALDPGHELDERVFSPPVRQLYAAAREELGDPEPALIAVEVDATEGDRVTLLVSPGPWTPGAAQVTARVRAAGELDYRTAELERRGDGYALVLPVPAGEVALDYLVEARAPSGRVVATAGSEMAPLRVDLAGEEAPPEEPVGPAEPAWWATWWFWTVVGVVVAGGVTTAVVLTLPSGPEIGSLGSVRLE